MRCAHALLCRENQFLLEERDLLSQQLAAENLRESTTTPLQGNRGGVPARVLSPIPYFTPATPSTTGPACRQPPAPRLHMLQAGHFLGCKHAARDAASVEVKYIFNWAFTSDTQHVASQGMMRRRTHSAAAGGASGPPAAARTRWWARRRCCRRGAPAPGAARPRPTASATAPGPAAGPPHQTPVAHSLSSGAPCQQRCRCATLYYDTAAGLSARVGKLGARSAMDILFESSG